MPHSTSTCALHTKMHGDTDAVNSQLLNEIMPMIYKRFTEKSAEEWRQIYKALQLMEFLVKNGSERVIDDARSHLSLLKMLRQFQYIDLNGKDQGLNVRNRSKELTDLLSDVEKIRSERKKARATKNKYQGVEGGAGGGMSVGSGGGGRYGGFEGGSGGGSANYGGSSRAVYGDGGGFGGETQDEEYDEGARNGGQDRFEEYNEFDDGGAHATTARRKADAPSSAKRTQKKAAPPKPKEPEVDLFDFGDEPTTFSNPSTMNAAPSSAPVAVADDDDFDDFQSATPSTIPAPSAAPSIPKPNYSSIQSPASTATTTSYTQFAQPSPQSGTQNAGFNNIFSTISSPPSSTSTPVGASAFSPPLQAQQPKQSGYQPSGPNYFTSVQVQPGQQQAVGMPGSVTSPAASIGGASKAAKKPAGGDAFASLLSGSGMKKSGVPAQKGLSIADMAKQKSQAGMYGANASIATAPASNGQKSNTGSSGLDDLLG